MLAAVFHRALESEPYLFCVDECLERTGPTPPPTLHQTHRGTVLSIKLVLLPGTMCNTIDDIWVQGLRVHSYSQTCKVWYCFLGWERERSSVLVKTHLSGTACLLLCTWSPIHLHLLRIWGPFLRLRPALSPFCYVVPWCRMQEDTRF